MELPEESPSSDSLSMLNVLGVYRPPSLDSLPCNLPAQKCRAWTSRSFPRCLLGALCMVSTFEMCLTRNAVWLQPVDQSARACVCVWTGVLQLPASGDLPADDWSAMAGRGPGKPGAVHAAAACPLWLLSVSVPRADGGARRTQTHAAMTTTGSAATLWQPFQLLNCPITEHPTDNKTEPSDDDALVSPDSAPS